MSKNTVRQLNFGQMSEIETAIVDGITVKATVEHGRAVSMRGACMAALACMASDDPAQAWRVYYDRSTDKADFFKAIGQGISVADYLEAMQEARDHQMEIEGGFLE